MRFLGGSWIILSFLLFKFNVMKKTEKKRKVMKITEERMKELLPPNILESELSLASQKVLAALIDWYRNSQAYVTKDIFIDNKQLAMIAGVGGNQLQEAFRQLHDYRLVDRIKGTSSGNASQYIIHFNRLIKPLKKMTFEEMFAEELEEEVEPSEKPISTTVHNSTSQVSLEEDISEKGILVKGISDKVSLGNASLGKVIPVEGSQDNSSTEKSILEDGILEEVITERHELDNSDIILNKKSNNDSINSNSLNKGIDNNILNDNTNDIKENDNKELLKREFERELTEPMTKDEEEGKENSTDTSPIDGMPLADGTQIVGLFDSNPLQENQETRQLSVRALTRKWAQELEAKYQGRVGTLQHLAIYDPYGFEKYVNYLRLQQRPAFVRHQELMRRLASTCRIDMDLDLD